VVNGIDFQVTRGEVFGIVGESGCGKTTTAMMLMGLIRPSAGKVYYKGHDLFTLPPQGLRQLRSSFQMVFQNPAGALNPRMRVQDIMAEPFRLQRKKVDPERIGDLLANVGLDRDQLGCFPCEISSGQKQRLVIARALALEPEVLVLDEPTSALDVNVQAQVLNLLTSLRQQFNLTYVLVSHNLGIIRNICHRVAVMYRGKIVEMGSSAEVFTSPFHPYTKALFSAIPSLQPQKGEQIILADEVPNPNQDVVGCPFHSRCPQAQGVCWEREPLLEQRTPRHEAACWM
jgi:peptide/nickel transport system ATP-binding protein